MDIRIVSIHPAESPKLLNTEWFLLHNTGDKPFSTRNCVVSVSRVGSKKKRDLGTMEPGVTIPPGDKLRVVTGNPGRKAHGKAPDDELPNYNLFLNAPTLRGKGTVLVLSLRSHVLTRAEFDPDAESGLAAVS